MKLFLVFLLVASCQAMPNYKIFPRLVSIEKELKPLVKEDTRKTVPIGVHTDSWLYTFEREIQNQQDVPFSLISVRGQRPGQDVDITLEKFPRLESIEKELKPLVKEDTRKNIPIDVYTGSWRHEFERNIQNQQDVPFSLISVRGQRPGQDVDITLEKFRKVETKGYELKNLVKLKEHPIDDTRQQNVNFSGFFARGQLSGEVEDITRKDFQKLLTKGGEFKTLVKDTDQVVFIKGYHIEDTGQQDKTISHISARGQLPGQATLRNFPSFRHLKHQNTELVKDEVVPSLALTDLGSKMAMEITHIIRKNRNKATKVIVDESIPLESLKKFKHFPRLDIETVEVS